MDEETFCARLSIERRVYAVWVERGLIAPRPAPEGRLELAELDIARGRLILDLERQMGIDPTGIDIIVDLIDQIHGLRAALNVAMRRLEETTAGRD